MQSRTLFCLVMGGMLVTIASCAALQANQPNFPQPTPRSSAAASAETEASGQLQPDTKVITMSLEGEPREVELKRFHQDSLPFTTYYPEGDFQPEITSSAEGSGVRFYFSPTRKKDENAYISFFFPKGLSSIQSIQDLLLGERGVLVKNGWDLVDRTDIVSYPWAKEKLIYQYQQDSEMIVGSIYVGQEAGQSFYTLTHYPAEYGDGFEPRSNIVLENLQFEEK